MEGSGVGNCDRINFKGFGERSQTDVCAQDLLSIMVGLTFPF